MQLPLLMNCSKKITPSQFIREIMKKLVIEMHKVKHKIALKLMYELFQETKHPSNLWNDHTLRTCNIELTIWN